MASFAVGTRLFAATFSLSPTAANAAGTAYGVDTAEVGDRGDCKVEAWTSWASNRDGLVTVSPSCIISSMPRAEFVVQTTRGRADHDWSTAVSPFIKFNLLPTAIGGVGFGIVGGTVYDAIKSDTASNFAYVPATLRLSKEMRINFNGGWINDRANNRHFATYGIGWDWLFMPKFSMTSRPSASTTATISAGRPARASRAVSAIARSMTFSVDLIYGRNINGEGSHWITLSTAYRFTGF